MMNKKLAVVFASLMIIAISAFVLAQEEAPAEEEAVRIDSADAFNALEQGAAFTTPAEGITIPGIGTVKGRAQKVDDKNVKLEADDSTIETDETPERTISGPDATYNSETKATNFGPGGGTLNGREFYGAREVYYDAGTGTTTGTASSGCMLPGGMSWPEGKGFVLRENVTENIIIAGLPEGERCPPEGCSIHFYPQTTKGKEGERIILGVKEGQEPLILNGIGEIPLTLSSGEVKYDPETGQAYAVTTSEKREGDRHLNIYGPVINGIEVTGQAFPVVTLFPLEVPIFSKRGEASQLTPDHPSGAYFFQSDDGRVGARAQVKANPYYCLLYTSPSPRDRTRSRMPSSA